MKKRSPGMRMLDKMLYPLLNWLSKSVDRAGHSLFDVDDLILPHQKKGYERLMRDKVFSGAIHQSKIEQGAYLAGVMNQVPEYEHGPIPWENPAQYVDRIHRIGLQDDVNRRAIQTNPGDESWVKDRFDIDENDHFGDPLVKGSDLIILDESSDLPRFEDTEAGRRPRYYHGLPTRTLDETLELIRVKNNDLYQRVRKLSPKNGLLMAIKEYGLPEPDSTDNPLEVSGGVYEAVEKREAEHEQE